jgi:hypothetical protein
MTLNDLRKDEIERYFLKNQQTSLNELKNFLCFPSKELVTRQLLLFLRLLSNKGVYVRTIINTILLLASLKGKN